MPITRAAGQSIMTITFMALVVGLCIRFRIALEVVGFWATVSRMMFRTTKRIDPITDARRKSMNFLAVRHGWTNARIKAFAAKKASNIPGGLSSIPMDAAVIVNTAQIIRRMNVTSLFRGVESASIIDSLLSCLEVSLFLRLPNGERYRQKRDLVESCQKAKNA